jgi:hypothetical protein
MTDSFIEDTLVTAFKTLSLIKSKTISGKVLKNVAEINKAFDPSNWLDEGWYEIDFLPGEPTQAELGSGGQNRWVGLMQVTVCVPINSGKSMANARYNAIATLFARGTVFSGVEITGCFRQSEDSTEDHYCLPVRIAYRADLAN